MENPTQQRPVICAECAAEMEPLTFVEPVPTWSLEIDQDDPDHESGAMIDVSGEVRVGLSVCRNCHEIIGTWIESSTAPFHADWGERR